VRAGGMSGRLGSRARHSSRSACVGPPGQRVGPPDGTGGPATLEPERSPARAGALAGASGSARGRGRGRGRGSAVAGAGAEVRLRKGDRAECPGGPTRASDIPPARHGPGPRHSARGRPARPRAAPLRSQSGRGSVSGRNTRVRSRAIRVFRPLTPVTHQGLPPAHARDAPRDARQESPVDARPGSSTQRRRSEPHGPTAADEAASSTAEAGRRRAQVGSLYVCRE
jgi:hypothetical protein